MRGKRRNKKMRTEEKEDGSVGQTRAEMLPRTSLLPFEVIQEILEISGDIQLLKTCRLVSKSWNDLSCGLLRKTAAVAVDEGEESMLEDFRNVLFNHFFMFPPEWPNPFQNYSIRTGGFKSSSTVSFCNSPNVRITSLEITHSPESDIQVLQHLLKKSQQSLTRLSIKAKSTTNKFIQDPQLLTDLSLSTLELSDSCEDSPCEHMKFCKIAAGQNLKCLILKASLKNTASCLTLLPISMWGKLRALHLEFQVLSTDINQNIECLKRIGTIAAPSLTSLTILFPKSVPQIPVANEYTDCVLPLIKKAGPNLRSLATNCLPLTRTPACPKLENLKCDVYEERLEFITEKMFPSLVALDCSIYWSEIPPFTYDSTIHNKVRSLTISDTRRDNPASLTIWPSASSIFPNLKKLTVTSKNISRDDIYVMNGQFGSVPSLELHAVSERDLQLIEHTDEFCRRGWTMWNLATELSWRFEGVQRLIFGRDVLVTRSMVQFYLPELSVLTHLGFYWNPDFSAEFLAEYLICKQLNTLSITYQVESQKKELLKLKELLPMLSLKYKRIQRN